MLGKIGARDAAALLCSSLLALLAACSTDQAVRPDAGSIGLSENFDADTAAEADVPRDISVILRNLAGLAVPGVRVEWKVQDGGVVAPAVSVTDSLGRASTKWTLGDSSDHRVIARAKGFGPLTITSRAHVVALNPLNQLTLLDLTTYDGGGETVHPDYVMVDDASLHGKFLTLTPYKGGNSSLENPAIYSSMDRVVWRVPAGAPNPLVMPTEMHLSDPDIVYDPVRAELMLYYREVGEENTIRLIRSADAIHWTDPVAVTSGPNHEVVSPSIVRRSEHEWLMWAVNAHYGCSAGTAEVELRRSTDGIEWSSPEPVSLSQTGFFPWHIDVQWIPSRNEYWAIYNVKTPGSCTTPALYLATSRDGLAWKTYPTSVLARGAAPAFQDIVYRSTFAYDPASDNITFWYSGARYVGTNYAWSSMVQRRSRTELFAHIALPVRASVLAPGRNVPPLRNPP